MARTKLQEMDVAAGTKQSKTAVNANAKPPMPMDTSSPPSAPPSQPELQLQPQACTPASYTQWTAVTRQCHYGHQIRCSPPRN